MTNSKMETQKMTVQSVSKGASKRTGISYGHQWIDEEDTKAVIDALGSFYLTTGPAATLFEEDLCRLTGARHAIVCANGTAALHLACLVLGISRDDLGLTSPITFLSSANCIEFCRGRVDFVDIDLETLCLSPERLEDYCRTVTVPRVVVTVDFAGVASDMVAIKNLSEKYGFKIIEDAAHSIGTTYTHENSEYHCGGCTHTDVAIFSFHPVKTITCGEGGAVLTNDDELAERIRNMRSHGMERDLDLSEKQDGPWYYEMRELGYNNRITDFQCALGQSQLKKLGFF